MTGSARIIRGNALALPLADASVDLICTSPPYFGLRSYQDTPQLCDRCRELLGEGTAHSYPVTGRPDYDRNLREAWPDWDAHVAEFHQPKHYAGQIGSEATPAEFIDALAAATREMVRVLKPSGSIFVNLGDKYSTGASGQSDMARLGQQYRGGGHAHKAAVSQVGKRPRTAGMPPKCQTCRSRPSRDEVNKILVEMDRYGPNRGWVLARAIMQARLGSKAGPQKPDPVPPDQLSLFSEVPA